MKISLNWLSQYIDLSGLSVDEMSDMLTFAGIEVEDIRQQGVDSPYVVVALSLIHITEPTIPK